MGAESRAGPGRPRRLGRGVGAPRRAGEQPGKSLRGPELGEQVAAGRPCGAPRGSAAPRSPWDPRKVRECRGEERFLRSIPENCVKKRNAVGCADEEQ